MYHPKTNPTKSFDTTKWWNGDHERGELIRAVSQGKKVRHFGRLPLGPGFCRQRLPVNFFASPEPASGLASLKNSDVWRVR
jgi:hypothetical protein